MTGLGFGRELAAKTNEQHNSRCERGGGCARCRKRHSRAIGDSRGVAPPGLRGARGGGPRRGQDNPEKRRGRRVFLKCEPDRRRTIGTMGQTAALAHVPVLGCRRQNRSQRGACALASWRGETMTSEPGAPSSGVILIVEEEDVLLRLVTASDLRHAAFEVLEAANAAETLTVLNTVAVDALISDVNLPGDSNGLGLAQWVQRRRPTPRSS